MSERSRYPLLIALILGVLAAFLLWWRARPLEASLPYEQRPPGEQPGAAAPAHPG